MPCTENTPCLAPMLRWKHSNSCYEQTRQKSKPLAEQPSEVTAGSSTIYRLRLSIGMALQTNRSELLKIAVAELDKNPMPVEEQKEFLRLMGDLLEDREKHRRRIERLEQVTRKGLENARGGINGLEKLIEQLKEGTFE